MVAVSRPIRVLVAKLGLDGHDRGARVVATALRDAGMEVVYTGLRQTVDQVVAAAIQEDVDAVGISILSGAHMTLLPRLIDRMREEDLHDVLVVAGGIIPEGDIADLLRQGIRKVYTPGSSLADIVSFIRDNVRTVTLPSSPC